MARANHENVQATASLEHEMASITERESAQGRSLSPSPSFSFQSLVGMHYAPILNYDLKTRGGRSRSRSSGLFVARCILDLHQHIFRADLGCIFIVIATTRHRFS